MASTDFWKLVLGAIALNPQAFAVMADLPQANQVAINVLLLAGFSQAIGQSIILFINRVKPLRFVLSVVLSAILFVFSYGFWIWSTWLVSRAVFHETVGYSVVYRMVGLATAPQIFSFAIAMPYFGVPIQVLLSLWTLLAFVRGFNIATGFGLWEVFGCSLLGWLVLQILQRTIGRPIATLGAWLSNTAAGINLVTDLRGLETLLETGLQGNASNQDGRKS
ncbi:MAG: hypothetical protein ACM37W_09970 [Actinomycetota bacterium]